MNESLPATCRGKGVRITSGGWQVHVTLCDPIMTSDLTSALEVSHIMRCTIQIDAYTLYFTLQKNASYLLIDWVEIWTI